MKNFADRETMQIEPNKNQVTKYKKFLFQDFYISLKNNWPLELDLSKPLKNFCAQIRGSQQLTSIYLKTIDVYILDIPEDAIFFADKICTLLQDNVIAVYLLAECYYLSKDYVKVNFLFHKHNLIRQDENFLLLGIKSLKAMNQLEQVTQSVQSELVAPLNDPELLSELHKICGISQQLLENQEEAENNFETSLQKNPHSIESFFKYIQLREIRSQDFNTFLDTLNFEQDSQWIKSYYTYHVHQLNKDSQHLDQNSPTKVVAFEVEQDNKKQDYLEEPIISELIAKENTDLLYLKALHYFSNYQINSAFELCCKILEQNYFHFQNLLIYGQILVEKNMISELFSCSTNLAENYPEHFITFHVFGLYYFLLKKYDNSRKYFNKAIQLNKNSLQSWIMLGHAYANQEEIEQAMNAYRSSMRLFPNSHLPHIYMGMEYIKINNFKTALLSFQQAKQIIGPDPIVYNEIGCIYLQEKNYIKAKKNFNHALSRCQFNGIQWLRHIILTNIGNAYRKQKEYQQAIASYEESLSLCPNDPAVLFQLAYSQHLSGAFEKAIVLYHKVVVLKYDTHFVNYMLTRCLNDLAQQNQQGVQIGDQLNYQLFSEIN